MKRFSIIQLVFILKLLSRKPRFRKRAVNWICHLEKGQFYSATFRELMRAYYNVNIGRYSYGECLQPGRLPRGTIVGNYCSFASGISVFRRNHPGGFISLHPFFYNSTLGWVEQDTITAVEKNPLVIMHDSWIGEGAIVTPRCKRIGIGSIVGAGAVVTQDVPDFSVVAGNPMRLIKKRFNDDICSLIIESCWWKYNLEQLLPVLPIFSKEVSMENVLYLSAYLRQLSPA